MQVPELKTLFRPLPKISSGETDLSAGRPQVAGLQTSSARLQHRAGPESSVIGTEASESSLYRTAIGRRTLGLIELEERARQAALRLGLRVDEFTFKVIRRKAYLQSSQQVCKLVQGQKTVWGIDCGLTYPSFESGSPVFNGVFSGS